MKKTDLKGLTLKELEEFALSIGEQKYRGKQLFDWLYTKEASAFAKMSSLSKALREKLASVATIESIRVADMQESREDGTMKFLFELADGKNIESVLIPPRTAFQSPEAKEEEEQKRLTLCVSTQVGCALDCKFCATASMGILRNLTAGEIIDQVLQVKKHTRKNITNIVYMGMGEPLMNYDNVMNSIEILTTGMHIAARRITISTAGWVPKIRQMADEKRKIKLAISLHSLDEHSRLDLMPVTKKFNLTELLDAVRYYYKKVKQRVTFEYILFQGWNDRDEDLDGLIKLSKTIPCKINIIPFHSIEFTHPSGISAQLHPTSATRAEEFVRRLREAHITVFVRSSAGEDIDAACGQLAVKVEQKRSVHRSPVIPLSPISKAQLA
ncbi:MAG: 23S rRNA (adenine(2503)-C(2))-methyltransferase RlmN [Ignavibacteria bacterium]|nr:23S rRNA (adenine(2503)-C(2))-methyltransferase RlmN [Ignavibacteria bacterium]MBI3766510.1 23S rRNA (adenine(2503)-C(2))-methyltransferase RlmN [Ignavibacteriales bacterium]